MKFTKKLLQWNQPRQVYKSLIGKADIPRDLPLSRTTRQGDFVFKML